jgi:CheY-like chemotaxis protein
MVVKHPVNGLLNVMIAELLISVPMLQRLWGEAPTPAQRKPLRAYLSHGFLLVATVPLLLLNIVNGENYAERQENEAGQRLQEAATAIRQDLEDYVKRHELAVRDLSRSITRQNRFDLDALNGWLHQTRQVYGGFQSITNREKCLKAGMNAYVSKPIQPDEVFETIEDAVMAGRAS